jgi:hypothetical protein
VGGTFRLVDPALASAAVAGLNGGLLMSSASASSFSSGGSSKSAAASLNADDWSSAEAAAEHYFLTDPDEFIYSHFPFSQVSGVVKRNVGALNCVSHQEGPVSCPVFLHVYNNSSTNYHSRAF